MELEIRTSIRLYVTDSHDDYYCVYILWNIYTYSFSLFSPCYCLSHFRFPFLFSLLSVVVSFQIKDIWTHAHLHTRHQHNSITIHDPIYAKWYYIRCHIYLNKEKYLKSIESNVHKYPVSDIDFFEDNTTEIVRQAWSKRIVCANVSWCDACTRNKRRIKNADSFSYLRTCLYLFCLLLPSYIIIKAWLVKK